MEPNSASQCNQERKKMEKRIILDEPHRTKQK